MHHNFPDALVPIRQNSSSNTYYTFGPSGSIGVSLASGEYYTGYWAAWYSTVDGGIKYKRIPKFSFINNQEGGPSSPAFSGLYSQSIQRITNLSFTFDNSGSPVFALQDNGDQNIGFKDVPEIQVKTNDNSVALTFTGYYPIIFNNLETNYPANSPPPLFQTFQTGNVVLYYTNKDSSILYSRFLKERFLTGHIVNSGLTPQYFNFSLQVAEVPSGDPYIPWQKIVYAFDRNKNLRVLAAKPGNTYSYDDFLRMPTGTFNVDSTGDLTKGFGPWRRYGAIGDTLGFSTSFDQLMNDTFENYPTGSGEVRFYQGNYNQIPAFYSGLVIGRSYSHDYYMQDIFNYPTGINLHVLDNGDNFSGFFDVFQPPGFVKSIENFIFDDFSSYQYQVIDNLDGTSGANFNKSPGRVVASGALI